MFYQRMKKNLTKAKITRIESWASLGFPDCVVGIGDRFVLVELKVAKASGKVELSPHQVAFHVNHSAYPCFVLVSLGSGPSAELFLFHAGVVKDLALSTINDVKPTLKALQNKEGWGLLQMVLEGVNL